MRHLRTVDISKGDNYNRNNRRRKNKAKEIFNVMLAGNFPN